MDQRRFITEAKAINIPQECIEAWPRIKEAINTKRPQTLTILATIPSYKSYPLLNDKVELTIKVNQGQGYSAYWPQSYNQGYDKVFLDKPIGTDKGNVQAPFSINPFAYVYKFAKSLLKAQTPQDIEKWRKWALRKMQASTMYIDLINDGAKVAHDILDRSDTIQTDELYNEYIDDLTQEFKSLTQIASGTIELSNTSKAVYYHELTHAFDPKCNWIHAIIDYSVAPPSEWFKNPKYNKLYMIDPAELDAMVNTVRAGLEDLNDQELMEKRDSFIKAYKTGDIKALKNKSALDRTLIDLVRRFKSADQRTYRKYMSKVLNVIDEILTT